MVQIKREAADRFLSKPDSAIRVLLIYGDDEGLVSERAERFATAVVSDSVDPISHVRLDVDAVADDPAILADEAHAVPLFGGRRAILIRVAGNRSIVPAIEMILSSPPIDSWVVVTAGALRKSSPLRRLAETHKVAAAVPCYADSEGDLDRLIDEGIAGAGLAIAAEARAALKGLIGGDRLVSRSEIGKLCLYAAGSATITVDDVRAVVGDAAAFAVDETIDAMALGDAAALDRGYRRLVGSGTPGSVTAGAALRHYNLLQVARAAYDSGASAKSLVERARPPIFFKRYDDVARQIAAWSPSRIERALAALDQAMIDSRLHGAIADEVIAQAMQFVASIAAGARRARSSDRSTGQTGDDRENLI